MRREGAENVRQGGENASKCVHTELATDVEFSPARHPPKNYRAHLRIGPGKDRGWGADRHPPWEGVALRTSPLFSSRFCQPKEKNRDLASCKGHCQGWGTIHGSCSSNQRWPEDMWPGAPKAASSGPESSLGSTM